MIGSDYPVIESGDFSCRECGGIASSLDFKSKSDRKNSVFVLWRQFVATDNDVPDPNIRV